MEFHVPLQADSHGSSWEIKGKIIYDWVCHMFLMGEYSNGIIIYYIYVYTRSLTYHIMVICLDDMIGYIQYYQFDVTYWRLKNGHAIPHTMANIWSTMISLRILGYTFGEPHMSAGSTKNTSSKNCLWTSLKGWLPTGSTVNCGRSQLRVLRSQDKIRHNMLCCYLFMQFTSDGSTSFRPPTRSTALKFFV